MNLQKRFAKIREIEATLPRERILYLISVEKIEEAGGGKPGVVQDVPDRRQAATLIADGFFRLATTEERAAFEAELARKTEEGLAETRMRRTESRLVLSPELLKAIGQVQ